jgi:hypothetical protein
MPSVWQNYCLLKSETPAREGRTDGVNFKAVAEKIEDLGRSEKRRLRSAIAQLYLHLSKLR